MDKEINTMTTMPQTEYVEAKSLPFFDEAIKTYAQEIWTKVLNGEQVNIEGHDSSVSIRTGDLIDPMDDDSDEEFDSMKLYEDDSNDTGDVFEIESVEKLQEVIKSIIGNIETNSKTLDQLLGELRDESLFSI